MVRRIAPAAAALLALAGAAPARAAVTWEQAPGTCYVSVGPSAGQREVVPIVAQGFTPGAQVDLLVDGAPFDFDGDGVPEIVRANEVGIVEQTVRAPYQPRGERLFGIGIDEHGSANTIFAAPKVTALSVTLHPRRARPSRRVRLRGRGFLADAPIWGHWTYRGRVRRTVRLARHPHGDCGRFSVRRRQIPVTRPRTGRWTLQVDQQHHFDPQPDSVFVRLNITVRRVLRH